MLSVLRKARWFSKVRWFSVISKTHLIRRVLDAGHFDGGFPLLRGFGPPYRKSEDEDELEEESDVDS